MMGEPDYLCDVCATEVADAAAKSAHEKISVTGKEYEVGAAYKLPSDSGLRV